MKKNRTKKLLAMLLTVCLTMALLPIAAFAADSNSDGYDDGDVAAVQAVINASPTLQAQYNVDDPGTWADKGLVGWNDASPKGVIALSLGFTNDSGEFTNVADFSGTLDASALTALEILQCGDNTGLTKLILPQTASLTQLRCYNTGITELDVSGCPALNYLECYNTGISELDVSNHTALTNLDCEGTNISSLELSNLSELGVLWCNGTNITSLDVSGNPKLYFLNCSNTGITALDVSGNTALTDLFCENTQLTALDLSANQSLINLFLPGSLEQLATPEGHRITLTQTQEGKIMLSGADDGAGNFSYQLEAKPQPGYEFVRWNGVTNFIGGTTEIDTLVKFSITGDMNISADFQSEERLSLAGLAVEGATLTPAFSGSVLNYTAVVAHNVTSVNIVAEGWGGYQHEITGTGEQELNVGENTFVVTLIVPEIPGLSDINVPEQTIRREYVITVTRQAKPAPAPTPAPTPTGELDDVPDTGDDSRTGLWIGLMIIALAGIAVCIAAWRRKRTN